MEHETPISGGIAPPREDRGFRLEEWRFVEGPGPCLWAPPELSPLSYLPSFRRLTPPQQVRYNQLFALGVAEQFIWFESAVLGRILGGVLRDLRGSSLVEEIERLLADENRHSEMFWRLLQAAAPDLYPERRFQFLKPGLLQGLFIRVTAAHPRLNPAWIWMAVFFEERTLDYSRHHAETTAELHPGFALAHRLHLQDEVRHVPMDLRLLTHLYDPEPSWKKWWARVVVTKVLRTLASPRLISRRILERMGREFPNLERDRVRQLLSELRGLRWNRDFLEMGFGESAVPRFRELLARYPEMRGVSACFGRE